MNDDQREPPLKGMSGKYNRIGIHYYTNTLFTPLTLHVFTVGGPRHGV